MTKKVRIENADNGTEKIVVVEVWLKSSNTEPDIKRCETILYNPTDMLDIYLTYDTYLIIKEVDHK